MHTGATNDRSRYCEISAPKYVSCNQLFQLMENDMDPLIALTNNQGKSIPQIFGIIHFVSGCDYLSHLKGFSKGDCSNAVLKHMDFIFSSDMNVENLFSIAPEHGEERRAFLIKFGCALYRFKYNSCFKVEESLSALMHQEGPAGSLDYLIENVRRNTWHKTIIDQNTN